MGPFPDGGAQRRFTWDGPHSSRYNGLGSLVS